jgi:hypothetical protein
MAMVAAGLSLACGGAAVMLRRAPANGIFLAAAVLLAAERLIEFRIAPTGGETALRMWMASAALVPAAWLVFSLVYARGDGGGILRRWRWLVVGAVLVPAGLAVQPFAIPARLEISGLDAGVVLLPTGKAWAVCLLLTSLGVLINLEKTFRGAVGLTRWRIKYLILGIALIFGVRVYALSQSLLFSGLGERFSEINSLGVILGCVLMGLGLARSGLSDLNIYLSRPVLQGSFTILLAGGYFLIVGLLSKLISQLGGIAAFPAQATVLLVGATGLAVLLLSDRLRLKLQRAISRHFHRPQYDFRQIWTRFSQRTAGAIDSRTLAQNVSEVVSESFRILGVTIFRTSAEPSGLEMLH